MSDKVKEKLSRLKLAVIRIIEKAEEDGIITEEEAKIIEKGKENLDKYITMVNQALEDDIITQDERNNLIDLEEKMMSDSYFVALEDNILDRDELLLLTTLYKTIDPRTSIDWLDEDT
jgi:hypothetical protein